MEDSLDLITKDAANVFGQFDVFLKKIERSLGVNIVFRNDKVILRHKDSG